MTVSNPADGNQLTPEQVIARDTLIEADYRAGIKPLRQIGKEHSLSHTFIGKMAKERGWSRDLTERIRAKADAKVSKSAVSTPVSTTGNPATEGQIVEANATLQFNVRMAHRQDIKRGRGLLETLMGELETLPSSPKKVDELLRACGDALPAAERAQLRAKLLHVGTTASRITSAKACVDILEKLIKLERQAFGIEAGTGEDNPASAVGAAAAAAAGTGKTLNDIERAIRLHRLLAGTPNALEALVPGSGAPGTSEAAA